MDPFADALELEKRRFLQPFQHLPLEKQSQLWFQRLTSAASGATIDRSMGAATAPCPPRPVGSGNMDSMSQPLSSVSPTLILEVPLDAAMQTNGDWSDGCMSTTPASASMSRSASHFSTSPGVSPHEAAKTCSYDAWPTQASDTWSSRREGPVTAYLTAPTSAELDLGIGEEPDAYLKRISDRPSTLPVQGQQYTFPGGDQRDLLDHLPRKLSASSHSYPSDNIYAHLPSPSSNSMAELTFATTAPTISRQGSTAGSSVLPDSFDLLRLNSSQPTIDFPLHDEHPPTNPIQSPNPSASLAMSSHDANRSHLLYGTGGVDDGRHLPSSSWTANFFPTPMESSSSATGLQRSASSESNKSSASCESTASMRHLANSQRQRLLPKVSARGSGPSRSMCDSARVSGDRRANKKVAINRMEQCQRKRPKLSCSQCDDQVQGFRGEHELRRHILREHNSIRSVWVCIEDATNPSHLPHIPISSCKQCKERKEYNAEYNAAAHLRRRHFGGKAGVTGNRGGTSGGTWPAMDELRRFIREEKIPRDAIPEDHVHQLVDDCGGNDNDGDDDDDHDLDDHTMLEDESIGLLVGPGHIPSSTHDEPAFPPCTTLQEANVSNYFATLQPSISLSEQAVADSGLYPLENYEALSTTIDPTYQYPTESSSHQLDGVMVDTSQHNSGVDQVASPHFFESSEAYAEETSLFCYPQVFK